MADQLMEVISGASHGSYSFIKDNYIYRINKFTHKRVYLSCRLVHCRGAGKGMKGASRGEIYGFKLSKPHNHPPEENKIRHFEVKEYVREEARCTQDTSKEIYERAVKLFDCYDLSRACVDGLVKRSRERTSSEATEKPAVRRSAKKKEMGYDVDETFDEEMIEKHLKPPERRLFIPSSEEVSGNENEAEYEDVERLEEVYEGRENKIEVAVEEREDTSELQRVRTKYSDGDSGATSPVREMLEEVEVPEYSDSNISESYSPEHPSNDSDSSLEHSHVLVVPAKRRRLIRGKPTHFPSQRPLKFGASTLDNNRSLKRRRLSDSDDDKSAEKHLSIEESLMKIFSSTYFSSKDNVFNLINNPESIRDLCEDEPNTLNSTNSLNIIKSASKLCTFATVKASQMRNLLLGKTKELNVLEDVLLEHLSNMMCFSGTEFFQKCFGRTLREAVARGKNRDLTRKSIWNEDEIYSVESKNDKMQLAVALMCYSGKAYTALGELIELPGPHIARKWATNSEGNPGFSAQSFAAIRKEVSASRSKTLHVVLSMVDVELMRQIDSCSNGLFGYTDLGYGRVESDAIPEATKAVLFHATAINSHWSVPLGYCLADVLSPQVRANLLSQYVSKLEFNGVKCVGTVLNSSTTAAQIYEEFGAVLKCALPLGSFHTNADEKIRVSPFVDIIEAMNSVKQLLKEKNKFITSTDEEISWSHLECVREFISSENSDWGLQPGTYSIEFINFLKFLKTKMQKDPWPFGRYYTVALKILQNYGPNLLVNSDPTITFIDHMVAITEIFTSSNRFHEKKLSFSRDKNSFAVINKLIHYLENLKFPSGRFIKDEDRRMPIMNLCMNLSSLKIVLRREFCQDGLFHRFSMRGVEDFVSEMRSGREMLTPVDFKERYLNCLRSLDMSPSGSLISRRKTTRSRPKFPIDFTFFSTKLYVYAPLRSQCDLVSSFFVEKAINVWIEAVACPECVQVMLASMQNDNSALHKDLVRLLRQVERELSVMGEIPVDLIGRGFHSFANRVLNELVSLDGFKLHNHLFVSSEFGSPCHFISLVKDFIEIYTRLRLMYLAREVRIGINDFHESSLKYSLGQFWA